MSGDTRASVQVPRDTIIIDPDPVNNNTPSQESSSSQAAQNDAVVIGEPADGFNIHQAMIFTHNYFEKIQIEHDDGSGDFRAKCLMCAEKKKEVLLKIAQGNLRGELLNKTIEFNYEMFKFQV